MFTKLVTAVRQQAFGVLALFVALGGTSYAVATGSIDSREVKNNSIRSKDLRNNDVRSRDVRDGSLLSRDFKAGQLPAGARGLQGLRGPQGAPGVATIVTRYGPSTTVGNGSTASSYAPCLAAEAVTGGGWAFSTPPANGEFHLHENRPAFVPAAGDTHAPPPRDTEATGWYVTLDNSTGANATFRAFAQCASPSEVIAPGPPEPEPTIVPEGSVDVCRYTGTPGVDEALRSGDNPTDVPVTDIQAHPGDPPYVVIHDPVQVGDVYSEPGGFAVVVAVAGDPRATIEDCPG